MLSQLHNSPTQSKNLCGKIQIKVPRKMKSCEESFIKLTKGLMHKQLNNKASHHSKIFNKCNYSFITF